MPLAKFLRFVKLRRGLCNPNLSSGEWVRLPHSFLLPGSNHSSGLQAVGHWMPREFVFWVWTGTFPWFCGFSVNAQGWGRVDPWASCLTTSGTVSPAYRPERPHSLIWHKCPPPFSLMVGGVWLGMSTAYWAGWNIHIIWEVVRMRIKCLLQNYWICFFPVVCLF